MNFLIASTILFFSCNAGPVSHFIEFQKAFSKKGHQVEIFASGPAAEKCRQTKTSAEEFSLEIENISPSLLSKLPKVDLVITDVGHPFMTCLHQLLENLGAHHLAYYDNPEAYVPNFSEIAIPTMIAAQGTLFANANLAKDPNHFGIGYYPIDVAEKIKALRGKKLKTIVFLGGNGEEFFSRALPAAIQIFNEAAAAHFNFNVQFLQHPGAKEKNKDINLLKDSHFSWQLSDLTIEEALVKADIVCYYQTSMSPLLILAGIPTFQIGHQPYKDLPLRYQLCTSVIDSKSFIQLVFSSQEVNPKIYEALGIHADWEVRLEQAISHFQTKNCGDKEHEVVSMVN